MCTSRSCGCVVEHQYCNCIENLDVMLMSLPPPEMSYPCQMYLSSPLDVMVVDVVSVALLPCKILVKR